MKGKKKALNSPRFWLVLRLNSALILAGILTFGVVAFVAAAPNGQDPYSVSPHVMQQATAYPYPSEEATLDNSGYPYPPPGATESPTASSGTPVFTLTPTAVVTPTETSTPTITSTLPPDKFKTENAEMGASQVTPVETETPGPSITPYQSPTPALSATSLLQTTPDGPKKSGGEPVDWGLFWVGFSVPVLAASGFVLYLLDRRPNFFRRSRKKD